MLQEVPHTVRSHAWTHYCMDQKSNILGHLYTECVIVPAYSIVKQLPHLAVCTHIEICHYALSSVKCEDCLLRFILQKDRKQLTKEKLQAKCEVTDIEVRMTLRHINTTSGANIDAYTYVCTLANPQSWIISS